MHRVSEFNTRDLSNLAWAFATLGVHKLAPRHDNGDSGSDGDGSDDNDSESSNSGTCGSSDNGDCVVIQSMRIVGDEAVNRWTQFSAQVWMEGSV